LRELESAARAMGLQIQIFRASNDSPDALKMSFAANFVISAFSNSPAAALAALRSIVKLRYDAAAA
jgi:hypothetical protein